MTLLVAYDPVAGELIIDRGDGQPPIVLDAPTLDVKFYGGPGRLVAAVGIDVIEVELIVDPDDPGRLVVDRISERAWRLRLQYLNPDPPPP